MPRSRLEEAREGESPLESGSLAQCEVELGVDVWRSAIPR